MGKLWRRIHFLLNRRRLEQELAEDMAAHREMMPGDRAPELRECDEAPGGLPGVWLSPWIEGLWQDLRYGVRVLRQAPGFTVGAVLVLALGVGVNLVEFQIFDAMIFHRLDVRDPAGLLQFSRNSRAGQEAGNAARGSGVLSGAQPVLRVAGGGGQHPGRRGGRRRVGPRDAGHGELFLGSRDRAGARGGCWTRRTRGRARRLLRFLPTTTGGRSGGRIPKWSAGRCGSTGGRSAW